MAKQEKRIGINNAVHEIEKRFPQAGIIFERLNNKKNMAVEKALYPAGTIAGHVLRRRFADEVTVHQGIETDSNANLQAGRNHLDNGGVLILVELFHDEIDDGIVLQQIVESGFGGHYTRQVMPFSYKHKLGEPIPDLPPQMPLHTRVGVNGFIRVSKIHPVFVPNHYIVTDKNRDQVQQFKSQSHAQLHKEAEKPKTIINGFARGTRDDSGQMERPDVGWTVYTRIPGVKLMPVTHEIKHHGRKKVLSVQYGPLLTHRDILDYALTHNWNDDLVQQKGWDKKKANFTQDDAFMAIASSSMYIPTQKFVTIQTEQGISQIPVDPRGIFIPENIIECPRKKY